MVGVAQRHFSSQLASVSVAVHSVMQAPKSESAGTLYAHSAWHEMSSPPSLMQSSWQSRS